MKKRCSACGEWKPLCEYYKKLDGLQPKCKECVRAYAKARYDSSREEVLAINARSREKHIEKRLREKRDHWKENSDEINEKRRLRYASDEEYQQKRKDAAEKWARDNPERKRIAHKKWTKRNRKRVNELYRRHTLRYRKRYRKIWRVQSSRRRARMRDADGDHTVEDVKQQHENQKGKCYYCQEKVGDDYHVDHIVPISRGGSNGPENIVVACPACNCRKSDKLPHEWAEGGRLL